jgi:hypothetical protein
LWLFGPSPFIGVGQVRAASRMFGPNPFPVPSLPFDLSEWFASGVGQVPA